MFPALSRKLNTLDRHGIFRFYTHNRIMILSILLCIFLFSSWMENVILSVGGIPSYNPVFDVIFTVLRYVSYGLMAVAALANLLLEKTYSPVLFFGVGILSALVFLFSRSTTFAILTLYLFAFTPLGFKRGIRIYLLIQGLILLMIPVGAAFHLFPDLIMDAERMRHGLGYTWVTSGPILFLFFLFGLMMAQPRKLNGLSLMMIALCSTLLFLLTDTRFAFLMSLIAIVLVLAMRYFPRWFSFMDQRWFMIALALAPLVLSVLSVVLTLVYSESNTFMAKINSMLSGRLANGKRAWDQFGFSLFGKPIVWVGNTPTQTGASNYLYVDCSYLNILLNYGFLYLLLVLSWCSLMVIGAWKRHDRIMMCVLFLVFFLSFYEVRLINPLYNPLLLFASRDLARAVHIPGMDHLIDRFHEHRENAVQKKTALSSAAAAMQQGAADEDEEEVAVAEVSVEAAATPYASDSSSFAWPDAQEPIKAGDHDE